eukprot:SAG25_NODE_147_length_13803_cov_29.064361_1_plen_80_part_10
MSDERGAFSHPLQLRTQAGCLRLRRPRFRARALHVGVQLRLQELSLCLDLPGRNESQAPPGTTAAHASSKPHTRALSLSL